jgi:hypothetical protein
MTTTSCYSMAPIATTTQIIMTSPTTTITDLSLSPLIFDDSSSVTFINDTNAYTTVDIN